MARRVLVVCLWCVLCLAMGQAQAKPVTQDEVLTAWYEVVLKLVRHTATYSPPVASRAFGYVGVTAYEAVASGETSMRTLGGQLNALADVPRREAGASYDEALVLHAALSTVTRELFSNTGPTGQRALAQLDEKLRVRLLAGVKKATAQRSDAYGKAIAAHMLAWAAHDGGARIENLGFAEGHVLKAGPAHWVPTAPISLQQAPLLPDWGKNRPFAMASGATCALPPPPAYSEDKASAFYREALEVYDTAKALTPEQRGIARFWADDAMLSPTPPGHWISIALQIFERDKTPTIKRVDVLARLGVAVADAFIGCWHSKFEYDLLRPVTYIRRVMDPKWSPLLITPPFPEYPSGHSTQSGAAAVVLTQAFGENFAFEDTTHVRDGIKGRHFASFAAAADEAALSRLYGGIHFRAAIELGLAQGRCIGAYANTLEIVK